MTDKRSEFLFHLHDLMRVELDHRAFRGSVHRYEREAKVYHFTLRLIDWLDRNYAPPNPLVTNRDRFDQVASFRR